MERYEADMPLGDTEEIQEETPSGFSVGWDVAQLSYGADVEDETYKSIHSKYKDYSKNAEYYDAWKNVENWTIENNNRWRHQSAIDRNVFALDENNSVIRSENNWAGIEYLYDMDAIKGALLSQKNGFNKDVFNAEYSNITKSHSNRLAKEREGTSTAGYITGTLAGHMLQKETAIDFMSPGKIMGKSIIGGAAKAFATEFGFALVGETLREQRITEHMEKAGLEYTLWDSVENILINSGFAGAIRGIGSAVIDKVTFNKIKNGIPDKTDKEIFERFARRENYRLTNNTNKHIDLMHKAKNDMDNGKVADVAEHTEIDIETKTSDAVEEVSIADELAVREKEQGLPEQTQKFEADFDETPTYKDATDSDPYEGMTTTKEADELNAEMAEFDPEIKIEMEAIRTEKKALSEQAQRVKEASEPTIGGSEEEAAEAVKGMFKKNVSEEAYYKTMSKEDIAEIERVTQEDIIYDKPRDMSNDDWAEAQKLFGVGGGLISISAISQKNEDK